MKKIFITCTLLALNTVVFAQQYNVPDGAVLLESTIMKDNGKPYLIETSNGRSWDIVRVR